MIKASISNASMEISNKQEGIMKVIFVLLFLLSLSFSPVQASSNLYGPAIDGQKSIKIIFDVNVGEPEKLLFRMRLIDQTYSELQEAGITPVFVIAFRGEASRFITRGSLYLPEEDRPYKQKMREWLKRFKEKGFTMQQCTKATDLLLIDIKDLVSFVKPIRNGYISLAGYQSQGYSLIPMD